MNLFKKIYSVNKTENRKITYIMGFKITKNYKKQTNFDNLPIQKNKIVFNTFSGAYTCNPKYIAEEIMRQNLPYDLVWVVNKNILRYIHDFPKNIRLVMENSIEDLKETATAKIWVMNDRRIKYIRKGLNKRKGQVYIQTWHGSLGPKKTGEDAKSSNKKFLDIAKQDASQFDYLTSNAKFTTNYFDNNFWHYGEIKECGYPRNDIFFQNRPDIKEKVYKTLNISEDTKIIMYIPTFRDDYGVGCYDLDFAKIRKAMQDKFGGDWVIVLRQHPKILTKGVDYTLPEGVIDATAYSDVQELMYTSDAIITDYSSCIYDFLLSGKPGFIFATDIEKYNDSRGLYYPLTETPFPIAKNNKEMVNNIKNFDFEKYKIDLEKFLKDKGSIDDGQASKRVVEMIKEIIGDSLNA